MLRFTRLRSVCEGRIVQFGTLLMNFYDTLPTFGQTLIKELRHIIVDGGKANLTLPFHKIEIIIQ